jgi:hypothetical protein
MKTAVMVTVLLAILGCMREPTGDPVDTHGETMRYRATNGAIVGSGATRERMQRLARLVALALQDDNLRGLLYRQVIASPHPERKLDFARFTDGQGMGLLAAMAVRAGAGTTRTAIRELRDSVPAMEFYLPVAEHRAAWRGDRNLLVATSLEEDEVPVGYDLRGNAVPLRSDSAPVTPTLVLVPRESDIPDPDVARAQCGPESCGNPGGGGGSTTYPGIYMTYASLDDLHEPWTRGAPELEVYLVGPANANLTSYVPKPHSAGEYASFPSYFNQDTPTWTAPAGSRGVRVAATGDITALQGLYPPGTPGGDQVFALIIYEDDNQANVIIEKHPDYSAAVIGASLIVPRLQISLDDGNTALADGLATAGLMILANEVTNLTQLDDDLVGIVVDAQDWTAASGTVIPRSHVVMLNYSKVGEVSLQYWNY